MVPGAPAKVQLMRLEKPARCATGIVTWLLLFSSRRSVSQEGRTLSAFPMLCNWQGEEPESALRDALPNAAVTSQHLNKSQKYGLHRWCVVNIYISLLCAHGHTHLHTHKDARPCWNSVGFQIQSSQTLLPCPDEYIMLKNQIQTILKQNLRVREALVKAYWCFIKDTDKIVSTVACSDSKFHHSFIKSSKTLL